MTLIENINNMVDDYISDDDNEKSLVVLYQEKGSRNKRKFVSELPLETSSDSSVSSLTEFPRYELLEEVHKGGTLTEIEPKGELLEEAQKGGTLTEIEPKGESPQYNEEQKVEMTPNDDWEDTITCQLWELLTQNLSTVVHSAVKRIAKCGYSEEIAEKVILRSGIYHGSKDVVSNIVNGALALLSWEKVFDIARHFVFGDLPSLVDYTLLEMVCVLREVKPALTAAEAMWCLLILDLNLVHACTMECNHLIELCNQESPGGISSGLKLSQSKTKSSENTQSNSDKQQLSKSLISIAQTIQSKVPTASVASQEPDSKNSDVRHAAKEKGSSTPLSKEKAKLKAAVLEDKLQDGQKTLISKKDLHREKAYQFEKNYRSRIGKNIKANITAWDSLVLEKKLNSSYSPNATKKTFHSRVNTLVKTNKPLAKASYDSPCPSSSIAPATSTSSIPPMQDNVKENDLDSIAMDAKSRIKAPGNTTISSMVPNYYAGIPYDESLGKYVPQNERDEATLFLTSHLKTLQKELQGWSDWANEKVKQVTRRLGKDQAELKMLRLEKEDAEKVFKETQMLEESTMEKIMELGKVLLDTTYIFEEKNSRINTLERENVELKEVLMLFTGMNAMNVDNALAKEQEAMKKCQAGDMEKHLMLEELSTIKQKITDFQQHQEKANKRLDQFEDLSKQEKKLKQRFLQQVGSLKVEREQLCVQGKVQQEMVEKKAERNLQKCKEEIQKCEREISKLRFQYEGSKMEALKQHIPQMKKGLTTYAQSSGSNVLKMERECVMCMNEQISVVFLPCAHQVLCEDCNVLHQKNGMDECPSCRTTIKERISVRFPNSK